MWHRVLLVFAFLFLMAGFAQAQSTLPAATGASSSLTMACPSPATGSQIWRCTGSSATCTLTSNNWGQLGTIAGASGTYLDSSGVVGQTYGYAGLCTEGAILAPPSNLYFGTPSAPLAAGTLSGQTT
jgi:hypothetical protein